MHNQNILGENLIIKQKEVTSMSVYENFPVANLDSDQLNKIMSLEKELRNETNENIVLIAYDEKDEGME